MLLQQVTEGLVREFLELHHAVASSISSALNGVDPGISVPPIGGGRTPVIPPPGTPGGDPNIQPK